MLPPPAWKGQRSALMTSSLRSDHLLGALLQIKELIRRRVENTEEEEEEADERGMTRRLEDVLRESSGELRTS